MLKFPNQFTDEKTNELVPTPAMEYAMYRALEYEINLVKCFSKEELMAQNNTTADDEVNLPRPVKGRGL